MTPLRGLVDRMKPHFKTTPEGRAGPAGPAAPRSHPAGGRSPGPRSPRARRRSRPPSRARRHGRAGAGGRPPTIGSARDEQLARRFAELQWDLGGLAYEMAIRDHFRLDLLVAQAARLQAVDAELAADERARNLQRAGAAGNCPTCGALYARGAAFCSQCGTHLPRPRPPRRSRPPSPRSRRRPLRPGPAPQPGAAAAAPPQPSSRQRRRQPAPAHQPPRRRRARARGAGRR